VRIIYEMQFQILKIFRHILIDGEGLDWNVVSFKVFAKFPHFWVNANFFHVDVYRLNHIQQLRYVSPFYNMKRCAATLIWNRL
jgi:hypothetical protein